MPDMLTALAEQLGDKPALIDDRPDGDSLRWSYAELEANANRLARVFLMQGVRPGDKVLWCGKNALWPVACGHAARKAAAVSVPLNYRLTDEEAAYVTHNSDAKIAFIDAEYAPLFRRIRGEAPQLAHVIVFDGAADEGQLNAAELMAGVEDGPVQVEADLATAGTMIYTSGTTGKPKGAVRTSAGDPTQLAKMLEIFGWRPDDTYLTTGPLCTTPALGVS